MRRKQEEQVQAAIKENEESELKVLRKNEERVERLRREYQEKEEKLIKEVEAKETKLKQHYEQASFQLGLLKRERSKDLKREFKVADEQLGKENVEIEKRQKKKNEESLALLLDQNEVELVKMMTKQEEKRRVVRRRKLRKPKQCHDPFVFVYGMIPTKKEKELRTKLKIQKRFCRPFKLILSKERTNDDDSEHQDTLGSSDRKRKLDQVETAATNQPVAPECPVHIFFTKITFTF